MEGTYYCSCSTGYTLNSDRFNCTKIEESESLSDGVIAAIVIVPVVVVIIIVSAMVISRLIYLKKKRKFNQIKVSPAKSGKCFINDEQ